MSASFHEKIHQNTEQTSIFDFPNYYPKLNPNVIKKSAPCIQHDSLGNTPEGITEPLGNSLIPLLLPPTLHFQCFLFNRFPYYLLSIIYLRPLGGENKSCSPGTQNIRLTLPLNPAAFVCSTPAAGDCFMMCKRVEWRKLGNGRPNADVCVCVCVCVMCVVTLHRPHG